jgi:hypothetical protein
LYLPFSVWHTKFFGHPCAYFLNKIISQRFVPEKIIFVCNIFLHNSEFFWTSCIFFEIKCLCTVWLINFFICRHVLTFCNNMHMERKKRRNRCACVCSLQVLFWKQKDGFVPLQSSINLCLYFLNVSWD